MAIYVVQARGTDAAALERARFVPEAFSWAAVVLAPLWLLFHRLWWTLAIWIAAEAAFLVFVYPHVPIVATVAVDLFARLFLGAEASRLRVAKNAGTAVLTDIVDGTDRDEAEAAFFRRHAAEMRAAAPTEAAA